MSERMVGIGAQTEALPHMEMVNRAAAVASRIERVIHASERRSFEIQLDETVKLGLQPRQGRNLYVVTHRHNAAPNLVDKDPSIKDEQVDSYYYIDSAERPATIETYTDDLAYERSLLEDGRFDQLKYWMGVKQEIFSKRTAYATQYDAQTLSQVLNNRLIGS